MILDTAAGLGDYLGQGSLKASLTRGPDTRPCFLESRKSDEAKAFAAASNVIDYSLDRKDGAELLSKPTKRGIIEIERQVADVDIRVFFPAATFKRIRL
jgi:hypothetical protein